MTLVLTSIGGILYFTLFSGFFNIRIIEVQGASSIDAALLEEAASIPFGENLFLQNYYGRERDLKKRFTIIKSVQIRQSLPDTVVIDVTEKEPALIVAREQGFLFVDEYGEVLDISGKLGQSTAPLLTGVSVSGDVRVGQLLVKDEIREALAFLAEVPETRLSLVRELALGDEGILLYPPGGFKVIIGENKEVAKKLNTLDVLIRDSGLLGNTVDYIDLSNPAKLIIKNKEGI